MFEDVRRVSIELSNLCNYSALHKYCPANFNTKKTILSIYVIKDLIGELKEDNWGTAFEDTILVYHIYNEPLIDPRLFWLIDYASKELPIVKQRIMTNGWYLNENILRELIDFGIDKVTFTIYNRKEKERILKIARKYKDKTDIHLAKFYRDFVETDRIPNEKDYRKCYAPLCDLNIRASGNVGLCCVDYKETVVFGNLYDETLKQIFEKQYEEMKKIQSDLIEKKRTLDVCKNCFRRRTSHGIRGR